MQSYVLLSEHKDKEESFHHRKNISPKNMQKNRLNIRIFSHCLLYTSDAADE